MALALDGTPQVSVNTSGGLTAVFSVATSNSISTTYGYGKCVVVAIANSNFSVLSVVGTNLTFTRRAIHTFTTFPGTTEEWVSDIGATPLSSETITVTWNGTTSYNVAQCYCVSNGGNAAGLAFDSGGPVANGSSDGSAGTGNNATMTVVNPNAFVIGFTRQSSTSSPIAGSPWTGINNSAINTYCQPEYQYPSSANTAYTTVSNPNADVNAAIIDAIIAAGTSTPIIPPQWMPSRDEPPGWSGKPLSSLPISILTATTFFGAHGQAPTKLWRNDPQADATAWLGKPIAAATLNLPAAGGTIRPPFYAPRPPDVPPWQGAPRGATPTLNLPKATPFSKQWRYDLVEQPVWVGTPKSNDLIRELTHVRQPPTKFWRYDHVEAPPWVPVLVNPTIRLPSKPVIAKQWHYDLAEFVGWQWTVPQLSIALSPPSSVTTILRAPFYAPSPGQATGWQWTPSQLAQILSTLQQLYATPPQWDLSAPEPPPWQWASPRNQPLLTTPAQTPPMRQRWRYDFVEPSGWAWEPPPPTVRLTPIPAIARLWAFNTFEPPPWNWPTPPSGVLRLVTEGGQPPTKAWRYDPDPIIGWQASFVRNASLLAVPLRPARWLPIFADEARWQGTPYPAAITYLPVTGTPAVPRRWRQDVVPDGPYWFWQPARMILPKVPGAARMWRSDVVTDLPVWNWRPVSNALKGLSPVIAKQWRYDFAEPAIWHRVQVRNVPLLTKTPPPSGLWIPPPSGETFWTGSPLIARALYLPIIEETQPAHRLWRYDVFDHPPWEYRMRNPILPYRVTVSLALAVDFPYYTASPSDSAVSVAIASDQAVNSGNQSDV